MEVVWEISSIFQMSWFFIEVLRVKILVHSAVCVVGLLSGVLLWREDRGNQDRQTLCLRNRCPSAKGQKCTGSWKGNYTGDAVKAARAGCSWIVCGEVTSGLRADGCKGASREKPRGRESGAGERPAGPLQAAWPVAGILARCLRLTRT